jgi:hypothetical protein
MSFLCLAKWLGLNMSKRTLLVILLLCLSGCGYRYAVRPLRSVSHDKADFIDEKAGVEIRLQQLDLAAASQLFNSKLRNSRKQTMYPLLLTVKNKSENKLLLKNKNIGLNLFTAQQLRQKFSKNTSSIIMGAIAAVPLVVIGSFLAGLGILVATVPVGGASGLLILPFLALGTGVGIPVIVGVAASKAQDVKRFNQTLSRNLKRKVLEGQKVKKYEKETVLLFASYIPHHFKISVINISYEEKITFDVNLKKEKS